MPIAHLKMSMPETKAMNAEVVPDSVQDGELRRLRPLGTFERFRAVLHDLSFHHNVSIIATYSGDQITRELLFSALRIAVDQHPALSVTLSGTDCPKSHFVSLEEFDLHELVRFIDCPVDASLRATRIDEILSEQHSLGFSAEGLPLWRVIVFHSGLAPHDPTDIAFVWHHVIGDGASGLAVHSTLLRAFSSSTINIDDFDKEVLQTGYSIIVPTPRKSLYPSMEEIFSLPRSLPFRISNVIKKWFPCRQTRRNSKKWSGNPYHHEAPVRTQIRHISISAPLLKRLIECCRREKTTITPFLQTLVGRALCETFEAADRVRCAVAISLRRFIPPQYDINNDAMGLWVSAYHVEYSRTQLLGRGQNVEREIFWKEARRNSNRIKQEIKKGDVDLSTGMIRYVPDFSSALLSKIGKKRDDSFAITNLGSFDGEEGSSSKDLESGSKRLRISNLFFSQSCHVNGSALQFCIVSVKDGDMNIAISWQEGTVENSDVEQVAQVLRMRLVNFCNWIPEATI